MNQPTYCQLTGLSYAAQPQERAAVRGLGSGDDSHRKRSEPARHRRFAPAGTIYAGPRCVSASWLSCPHKSNATVTVGPCLPPKAGLRMLLRNVRQEPTSKYPLLRSHSDELI